MDRAKIVGARIRAIRVGRHLTQTELAKRIGRSVGALSALERGSRKPGFGTLLRLADALDVPAGDFFPPGGPAGSAEHAALYGELLDIARALPPADLEMTVRIAAMVARRYAHDR